MFFNKMFFNKMSSTKKMNVLWHDELCWQSISTRNYWRTRRIGKSLYMKRNYNILSVLQIWHGWCVSPKRGFANPNAKSLLSILGDYRIKLFIYVCVCVSESHSSSRTDECTGNKWKRLWDTWEWILRRNEDISESANLPWSLTVINLKEKRLPGFCRALKANLK